ncbi:hypothetical protein VaNZ11_001213, partial [Volvox africanus]
MIRNNCYVAIILISIYLLAHLPTLALALSQLRTRRDAGVGGNDLQPKLGVWGRRLGRHDLSGSSIIYKVSNARRVAIANMAKVPVRMSATVTPGPTQATRDSQIQVVRDSLRNATFAKSVLVSVAAKLVRARVTLERGAFIRDCSDSSLEDYKARLGAAVGLRAADVQALCVKLQDVSSAQGPTPPVCTSATTLLVVDTTLRLQPAAKEYEVQAALAALPGGNAKLLGLCVPSQSYMPHASILLNAVLIMPHPMAIYADIAATTVATPSSPPAVSHGKGATAIRLDNTDSKMDTAEVVRWALAENLRQAIATAFGIPLEQVQLPASNLIIGELSAQPPLPSQSTARVLTAASSAPGTATASPSLSFRDGDMMHQQLARTQPWVMPVVVSASASAAVVLSMMLVSCLWARLRRGSDQKQRAAYSSRGAQSVIFHSLDLTTEAEPVASPELPSGSVAPITKELRKYVALTPPEASVPAEAPTTASCSTATAAVAATAVAVSDGTDDKAPIEKVPCQERVSCSAMTQPDRSEGGQIGKGGGGGGAGPVGPDDELSRGESLSEQKSDLIVAAMNSPRAAEAASSSSPPSSPPTSSTASVAGGSVLAARRPLQPQQWLPMPLPMCRTGPSGRVPQQQHQQQQALLKWAALRRLIEEKRAEAEASLASPSAPAAAAAAEASGEALPLPPVAVGAWTTSAPAIGSDRLKSIELPYVDDGVTAVPSGMTLGEGGIGQCRLSADAAGTSGTTNSGAGSGSGAGTGGSTGLLARVFSRKSRPSGSPALGGTEGRGHRVRQTFTGAIDYANTRAGREGDIRLSRSSSSAVSAGSVDAATKRRRRRQRRRPSREAVVAFDVDDVERGSGGTVVNGSSGGNINGRDDTDGDDDDTDGSYDGNALIHGSSSRDGRPSAGSFLAAAAWDVTPLSARCLQPGLSVLQDANGGDVMSSERWRPREGKRFSDVGSGPWRPSSGGDATRNTITGGVGGARIRVGSTAATLLPQVSMQKRNTGQGFCLASGQVEVVPQSSPQPQLLNPNPMPSPSSLLPSSSNQSSPHRQPLLSLNGSEQMPSVPVIPSELLLVPAASSSAQTRTHGSPSQSHNLSTLGLIGEDADVLIEEASRFRGNKPTPISSPRGGERGGGIDGG